MKSRGDPKSRFAVWPLLRFVVPRVKKHRTGANLENEPDYSELRGKGGIPNMPRGATRRRAVDARPALRLDIGRQSCSYPFSIEAQYLEARVLKPSRVVSL